MARRIKILESAKQLQVKILFELKKVVSKIFKTKGAKLEAQAKIIIEGHLMSSNTINSLLGGKLQKDFGLDNVTADRAVLDIINSVVNSINLTFDSKSRNSVGSVIINLLPADISNIAGLSSGSYINDGSNGGNIDWLLWLLTKGTQVVIGEYSVEYGLFPSSRSGGARMIEGGDFRVDPEHAGTIDDNFITRAVQEASPQIIEIIKKELQKGN